MQSVERRRGIGWLARSLALVGAIIGFGEVSAQQQPRTTLTLEEAIALAKQNNPDFLAVRNDAQVAEWSVRAAYGNLMPGASVGTGFSYQAAGEPRFGVFTGADLGISETPAYYSSDYSIGVNYQLSGASLLAPGREKAVRRATEAGIRASEFDLHTVVTRQYLAVVRARDGVALAEEELKRAEENLKLARARVAVGDAIPLDAQQAEVEKGRADVGLLQSRNLVQTELLRLMQQLGTEIRPEIELTSRFALFDIAQTQEQLVAMAAERNPQIHAARAQERASDATVKMARSAYLPSLSLSAGWSGYTRQSGSTGYLLDQARSQVEGARQSCQQMNAISAGLSNPLPGHPRDCNAIVLTPDQERQIIADNEVFPFRFSTQPFSAQLRVSLPLFNGLQREQQLEEAKIAQSDASYRVRSEELRVRTEVGTAHLNVVVARQSVALEERNRQLAGDQLRLATERYRVGAASFIELQEANTIKARADREYLIALYLFHESVAALEAAVGSNLRPAGEGR